jgi:pyruvate kinase
MRKLLAPRSSFQSRLIITISRLFFCVIYSKHTLEISSTMAHMHKRTKVVCTIGPASDTKATLTKMVRAGMNVARLNFSHGTHDDHARLMRLVRSVSRTTKQPVAILQDLQGPKIRTGNLPDDGVELVGGTSVTFTTGSSAFRNGKIPVTYAKLHEALKPKHRILLDDGLLEVRVTKVRGRDMVCSVVTGGILKSHKGMNLPDTAVTIPALTVKDRKDAAFGIANNVDWIALSFVKSAADVLLLRRLIRKHGGHQKIIAKIEKHEAIANFGEILKAVDGVMVARGDLGVEIPAEEVPLRQKEIIEETRAAGKPVVVATQMLDSMIRNPRPTRAEVSDVANAIIDHTDAIMLSGEAATGAHPVAAVEMMRRVAEEIEASPLDDVDVCVPRSSQWEDGDVVAETAALLASQSTNVHGILVATLTGRTARRLARFRPQMPVFAATPDPVVMRQLAMSYGIIPMQIATSSSAAQCTKRAVRMLRARKLLPKTGHLIVVSGDPWGQPGTANVVHLHALGS